MPWSDTLGSRLVFTRVCVGLLSSALLVLFGTGVTGVLAQAPATQNTNSEESRTVWDGVYAVDQAERGGSAYARACSHCHDTGEAPSVVGEAFIRSWFQEDLSIPFTRIQTTMPLDDAGSLGDDVYVEVLAFLLEASGFPPGDEPLSADAGHLAGILVVDEAGPGGPVPNFSLVQVIGCLTHNVDGAWIVTHATEPVRTREPRDSAPAALKEAVVTPLGDQAFQLLEPLPRRDLGGHTIVAKGFLVRDPSGDRLNPTSLQSLAELCPE